MSDAERPSDVSLETDRLEQLLEVPEPAQPVVMIEYRNRGVPWWLVISLIVTVPLVAVLAYQQLIVERFRAQASSARYLVQKLENERAAQQQTSADSPPVEPAASTSPGGAAPVEIITAQAAPAPEAKQGDSPRAEPEVKPEPAHPAVTPAPPVAETDKPPAAVAPQPPEPRVRSLTSSPIESVTTKPASNGKDGDSSASPAGPPGRAVRDDSANTKLAGSVAQPHAGTPPGAVEKSSTAKSVAAPRAASATADPFGEVDRPEGLPPVEALPTRDEMETQLAQESAKKSAELAEEQLILNDRVQTRRFEDRIRFHEELRQILANEGKRAGAEIDALAKRQRGDIDVKTFGKARGIWRDGRLPLTTRVSRIRSLDFPESEILNFISESIYTRIRTPGGPRDGDEVRVRAARLLLGCELSNRTNAPANDSEPMRLPERRKKGAGLPQ